LNKLTAAGLPVEVALELAGYELTEDQAAMLNAHQEQMDERRDNEYSPDVVELRKWQKMAEKRVKEGKELREFETSVIEPSLHGAISGALESAKTVSDVKKVFDSVIAWRGYP